VGPFVTRWREGLGSKSHNIIKTTQNISEGNYHSCYTSNKAEKFKLKKVTQGIDSCAHAQMNEINKEKRNLEEYLQLLRTEKNVRASSVKPQEEKEEAEEEEPEDSASRVNFRCPECEVVYVDEENETNQDVRRADTGREKRKNKSAKKCERASKPGSGSIHHVTPFYMQHGYSHYHYDPYYDEPGARTGTPGKSETPANDRKTPAWRDRSQESGNQWGRIPGLDADPVNYQSANFMNDIDENLQNFKKLSVNGDEELKKMKTVSSDRTTGLRKSRLDKSSLVKTALSKSISIDKTCGSCKDLKSGPSEKRIPISPLVSDVDSECSSVLTPSEREEISRYQNKGRRKVVTSPLGPSLLQHLNQKTEVVQARTYKDPAKVELLKKIAKNRFKKGKTVDEIASDDAFENVLDICESGQVFPAYDPKTGYASEDFGSLWKCRYLRLSDMNIASLKQVAVESLVDT